MDEKELRAEGLSPGSPHYRAFVGPPERYDLMASIQFNLLTSLGLREYHHLLDIGCGSLRAGKLFIPYLLPEHYCGIEPEKWLIDEAIDRELGKDILRIKRPKFNHNSAFDLTVFNREFDFLIAQSIFSHASSRQIEACLFSAKKVMKPSSLFVATFVIGKDNYTGQDWVYPSCVAYRMDYITELVERQQLACKKIAWPHPGNQTWMVIAHRDIIEDIPTFDHKERLLQMEQKLKALQDKLTKCKNSLNALKQHSFVKTALKIAKLLGR